MECSTCRNELQALQWVKIVASEAPEIPLPEEVRASVSVLLDTEEEQKGARAWNAFRPAFLRYRC